MTPHNELRLLPWSGPDGKPCYLSTNDEGSRLSRLADTTEAIQLDLAADLVAHATEVLRAEVTVPEDLRRLSTALTEALQDALRVATSRGHRLPAANLTTREEGNEGPQLQAPAFG
ncbi:MULTISPECIES: hypothetical protein [Streptomyces]|uniref:Uncharacterized protein n=1 Tax=Streptomyces venezuelae TaxID=54571 RepID=A0A5P2AV20_STRVZ|nr:hypothetical protein [Streptomyces venezuelae]QES21647.1 hypothetical protein DEJ46_23165 [Streptomyces venezuelae]